MLAEGETPHAVRPEIKAHITMSAEKTWALFKKKKVTSAPAGV